MDSYRDFLFKIVITGDYKVGKSSLMTRFLDNTFPVEHEETIGVDFGAITHPIDDKLCKMQMWDTSGNLRYKTITKAYFRGVKGAVFVFDITNRESYEMMKEWLGLFMECSLQECVRMMIANKCDLHKSRAVTFAEGKKFADQNGMLYMEASALTGQNVEEGFILLMANMKQQSDHL